MASMNKQWKPVQRGDNVQEHFMIGEFIQSDKWSKSSPPSFYPNNYPYIKDCIEFCGDQYGRDVKNEIRVTEITHGTSCENMLSIIKDGGFRPSKKCIPNIGSMDLAWFGLKIGEKEIDCVKENYKRIAQALPQYEPSLTAGIGTSPPFQPMSRYGNYKFTLTIKEVIDAYETQFCISPVSWGRSEMRKLGTFAYKMETMHVILVCPRGIYDTDQCPLLSDDLFIQPDETCGIWIWRPHSTGDQTVSVQSSGFVSTSFRRWEHVVFAFYIPKGRCLKITNLHDHLSLCLAINMKREVSGVNEAIHKMLGLIALEEHIIRKSLVNMLIRMIRCYIDEWPLYQKTMNSGYTTEDVCINLAWVVQRLRDILNMESTDLNWLPLHSVRGHTNLLHF